MFLIFVLSLSKAAKFSAPNFAGDNGSRRGGRARTTPAPEVLF